MTYPRLPKGCMLVNPGIHRPSSNALRYCGDIVMRWDAEWVTLRCPDARQMLRVPRPIGTVDNSAISILDGLSRSWRQYAAHRTGGWLITKRR